MPLRTPPGPAGPVSTRPGAPQVRVPPALAAAEVFIGEGYAKASLHTISTRAGVSSGALHFHFPNKDALAEQVECAAAALREELVDRSRAAADTALQTLVNTTRSVMLAAAGDPVIRAGFRLSGDPSRSGAELLRAQRARTGRARGGGPGDVQRRGRPGPGVREATVKAHVSSILGKLGVANRVQAAILARDAAWL
ncbi:TetR family transcriptional regulator [Streptomyces sp. MAR4 CNX-425]|uniref:TetR family transcriptional regulator n=1 Tax=Streptomyces sp. MAR4 CNX-425 TaxID=3406343 RepID=UPI003B511269